MSWDARPFVLHTRVVSGTGGGPDKTILNSVRYLDRLGYRSACAYLRDPRDSGFTQIEQRARERSVTLLAVDDRGLWDLGVLSRFSAICRELRPAIWHGHDYKSNLLGLLLRRRFPMHLVTTVHGWVKHTWKTPLYYAIDRFCLRHYEQVICVSEDLHQECLALGLAANRCCHVPNAIDTDEFKRQVSAAQAKEKAGLPPGRLVVGAIGRLSAEKGFDLLIQAAARLLARGLDFELWIAGEGDQAAPLARLVESLGLSEKIRLLGFHPRPIDLYEAMDVFVLSSLREGLPNVLLEAMALEVAVLSTKVAGIPRLIQDGANGLLIEPGSVDALASYLDRLLTDEPLRWRLVQAGRQTVEKSYSFSRRMERIKTVYEGVLGMEDGQRG